MTQGSLQDGYMMYATSELMLTDKASTSHEIKNHPSAEVV